MLDTTWDLDNVIYVHDNEQELTSTMRQHWANFIHDYGNSHGVDLQFGFSVHRDNALPPAGESWFDFIDTGFQWRLCGSEQHSRHVRLARERVNTPKPIDATQIMSRPWENIFEGAAARTFKLLM